MICSEESSTSNKGSDGLIMEKTNAYALEPVDRGTDFLFWGWIVVTLLNLGMVSVSLALFAP